MFISLQMSVFFPCRLQCVKLEEIDNLELQDEDDSQVTQDRKRKTWDYWITGRRRHQVTSRQPDNTRPPDNQEENLGVT